MWSSKKKVLILISGIAVIVLIFFLCQFYFYSDSININNEEFLKNYGWSNVTGGYQSYESKGMPSNYLDYPLNRQSFEVSETIGLKPRQFINKPIRIYYYNLGRKGSSQPLAAVLWNYKKKVVCAYILHTEPKIPIKYWPLNSSYVDIVIDIENMYKNQLSHIVKER